jgi:hypothetical protein
MKTILWSLLLALVPGSAAAATALPVRGEWSMVGSLSDACQCDVLCPCEFVQKPTYGHCDDTAILHIERGSYGGVKLDGQRVVVVSQSPEGERLVDTIGDLVFAHLYVSEDASDVEAQALAELARRVFGTWVGGKVARISPDEKVAKVSMTASIEPTRHKVSIPGVLELDIEALTGWDGVNPVAVKNGPAAGPGVGDILIARSHAYRYTDHGIDWNYAGRSASMRTLDLKGAIENVPAEPEPAQAPAGGGHDHHH